MSLENCTLDDADGLDLLVNLIDGEQEAAEAFQDLSAFDDDGELIIQDKLADLDEIEEFVKLLQDSKVTVKGMVFKNIWGLICVKIGNILSYIFLFNSMMNRLLGFATGSG